MHIGVIHIIDVTNILGISVMTSWIPVMFLDIAVMTSQVSKSWHPGYSSHDILDILAIMKIKECSVFKNNISCSTIGQKKKCPLNICTASQRFSILFFVLKTKSVFSVQVLMLFRFL